SYQVETKGSSGRASRRETDAPVDQDIHAPSMRARPTAVEPLDDPLGITISPSPASPIAAARSVACATTSRASVRQMTTCSGTDPAIIAATLESIRVSARYVERQTT